jgi:hypothetical protein
MMRFPSVCLVHKQSSIYWLAGLLEGEGTFCFGRDKKYPYLSVEMTDRGVVDRCASILGCRLYGPYRAKGLGKKKLFKAVVGGAKALEWMDRLYLLMGERRRKQIDFVRKMWASRKVKNPLLNLTSYNSKFLTPTSKRRRAKRIWVTRIARYGPTGHRKKAA